MDFSKFYYKTLIDFLLIHVSNKKKIKYLFTYFKFVFIRDVLKHRNNIT